MREPRLRATVLPESVQPCPFQAVPGRDREQRAIPDSEVRLNARIIPNIAALRFNCINDLHATLRFASVAARIRESATADLCTSHWKTWSCDAGTVILWLKSWTQDPKKLARPKALRASNRKQVQDLAFQHCEHSRNGPRRAKPSRQLLPNERLVRSRYTGTPRRTMPNPGQV